MQVMKWSVIAMAVAAGTSQMAFASAQSESKGFVEDASLDLLLRNTYWNRDHNNGNDDRNTWAQGFIATFESGFTQGTVGFGIDAYGLLGVRLDGGQGDMFPGGPTDLDPTGDWADDLSEAGAAVKLRLSNTTVKYGNQFVGLPVIASDDSRLLPEAFTGTLITSTEIEGLELNAGRFTADSPMGSPARDDRSLKSLDVFGGTYAFTDNLSTSLYFSDVEDTYDKKYANINYVMPLAEDQSLTFDFNYYKTDDIEIVADADDNTIWSLSTKYAVGAHAFIIAHQRVSGDTGYLYDEGDGGGSIWVANSFLSDFNFKDERSWQASYELDFSGYGIPGLAWKTAYLRGDNIDAAFYGGEGEATEREIFNQVSYTFQNGAAKDLTLRARNSILRTNNPAWNDVNEWRLYAIYPLSIL
ncbi:MULTISPECIES: OprD family porin [Pseudomonadaceae]|uniref:OprD family porin n=1 Tax=Pseudomonadaceae TaxID=135621 RepID=UPI00103ECA5E|nr:MULTISPECIES: OprD family porin [Pseudomonadaceae]MBA1277471.1 OprD family porin [Stutzerimonas stutzeri]MBC8651668.1 OprD family porin [Pseudomonas sp. MT4]QXY91307.1 OprD family porin [Pseudomonas sp. MTM4]TCD21259.1 OprD family porin [Pseudomonas sp. IC_126]